MDRKNLPTATAEYINNLNGTAQANAHAASDPYKALMQTADLFDLTLVKTDSDDALRIYETPDGHLVNLWLDAPGEGIAEGGMGFDDQTGWYTDAD